MRCRTQVLFRLPVISGLEPVAGICSDGPTPAATVVRDGHGLGSTPQANETMKQTPDESGETDRFEKIAVLDNEVQAELMDDVLSGRDIPHIMQSYYDSALDGLFQAGKGWGVVLAPASFKQEILDALADIKARSASSGPEDNNA